jgi:hypothetical protein
MGTFNEVFRILCDEAFIISGKEFALSWNDKLRSENSSIDESTVNRWKDDTLPRQFYLPKIIKLFKALSGEMAAAGENGRLTAELRARLAALSGMDARQAALKKGDDAIFLSRVIETGYLRQKTGAADGVGTRAARDRGPFRRPAVILLAVGACLVLSMLVIGLIVFREPPAFQSVWNYLHPAGYFGVVWIRVSPRPESRTVPHEYQVKWGEWTYRGRIDFGDKPHAVLVHFKNDNTSTVQLTFSILPPCAVSFGQGEPEDRYTININDGWEMEK